MTERKWGIGDPTKARHVGWTTIGQHGVLEVVGGEHPHSYSENTWYAKDDHGTIYDFDGHLILVDVSVKSYNYLKESELSGDEVKKGVTCTISADGVPVFEFFARDPGGALLRAHQLLIQLSEHPSDVMRKEGREKLVGRKVFYHDVPATITHLILDQGCVILEPETGHKFKAPAWREDGEDDEYEASVKDEILSPHIWWFRS